MISWLRFWFNCENFLFLLWNSGFLLRKFGFYCEIMDFNYFLWENFDTVNLNGELEWILIMRFWILIMKFWILIVKISPRGKKRYLPLRLEAFLLDSSVVNFPWESVMKAFFNFLRYWDTCTNCAKIGAMENALQ